MYFCCFREEVVLILLAFVREISARGNTVIAGFILLSRKIATSGVALLAMTEIKKTRHSEELHLKTVAKGFRLYAILWESTFGDITVAKEIYCVKEIATSGGCPPRNDADAGQV